MKMRTTARAAASAIVGIVLAVSAFVGLAAAPAQAATSGDWTYADVGGGNAQIRSYIGTSTDIIIPRMIAGLTVTSIKDQAFWTSTTLTSISFEAGSAVTTIPNSMCFVCTSLQSVSMPDTVTTIGTNAFGGAAALSSVNIPSSLITVGDSAFTGTSALNIDLVLPPTTRTLGKYAFSGSGITSLTLNDGLVTIKEGAFSGTQSLVGGLTIPQSVTTIGTLAFMSTRLSGHLDVPAGVSILRNAVFSDSRFDAVTLHEGLTTIEPFAFAGNNITGSVTIPDSVTTFGPDNANNGYQFNGNHITSVTLGAGMTEVPIQMFAQNDITQINWASPNNITTIHPEAFRYNALTSVVVADGVQIVDRNAFTYNHLLDATVPATLANAHFDAFGYQTWWDAAALTPHYYAGWFDLPGGYTVPDYTGLPATFNDLAGVGGTYYTAWNPIAVTFDANGGTYDLGYGEPLATYPTEVSFGDYAPDPPAVPTRAGWELDYYSLDQDGASGPVVFGAEGPTVTGPRTWYAQWKPATWDVTFDASGGSQSPAAQQVPNGDFAVTAMPGVRSLSTFAHWTDQDGGTWSFTTPVTRDLQLTAAWTARGTAASDSVVLGRTIAIAGTGFEPGENVAITAMPGDLHVADITATGSGAFNITATAPATAPAGSYTLHYSGSVTGESTEPIDFIVATVEFDAAGGYPAPEPQAVAPGDLVASPDQTPVKQLSRFVGWVDEDGQDWAFDADAVPTGTTVLTAVYEPRDTVAPTQVKVGATVELSGSGFEPGETVVIAMMSEPVNVATVMAGADGTIRATVVIPVSKAAGAHEFRFAGSVTGTSFENVAVIAPQQPAGRLANTGAEPAAPLGLAGALMMAGVLALVGRSSRRRWTA